jgi:hypothetical protein
MPCSPAGFEGLLAQALSAQAPASSNTIIDLCRDTFSDIPLPPHRARITLRRFKG